jgi:tetratricopeptide (TPR) repeat protein
MDSSQLQVYVQNNSLDQAASLLAQERAAAEAEGSKEKMALASNDLGVVYTMLDRKDEARAALEQAQHLFIELNDTAGQGRATGNLAQLEDHVGNKDASGALYMQAADLLHEGNAFADEYTTRKRLSRFYLTRGATMQALNENEKALMVKPNASAWDKFLRWVYGIPLKLIGVG